MKAVVGAVLLLSSIVLVGCASSPVRDCGHGARAMVQEMIYFGTQTPSGAVTPEHWAQFLATTVTSRFPQGLTVWPASGQWRSADGSIVREASYVLNLLHSGDAASEAAVQEVVADYKRRFRQEAVMRTRTPACASF